MTSIYAAVQLATHPRILYLAGLFSGRVFAHSATGVAATPRSGIQAGLIPERHIQLSHLAVQVRAVQAELFGRVAHVAGRAQRTAC